MKNIKKRRNNAFLEYFSMYIKSLLHMFIRKIYENAWKKYNFLHFNICLKCYKSLFIKLKIYCLYMYKLYKYLILILKIK